MRIYKIRKIMKSKLKYSITKRVTKNIDSKSKRGLSLGPSHFLNKSWTLENFTEYSSENFHLILRLN
jgi:hypothetical protein